LESLLKLGYSSKIPLSNATLPIHIAARTGSLRCCELIVGGCPECVLQKGENGMLPIDEARASAHPDVVEFLENAMAAAEVEQQEQGIHISKEGMQSIVVDEQNLPCVLNEVCQMPPSPRKSELFSQILMHNPPITAHLVRSLIECDDSSCLSLVVGCLFSSSISGKVEHAPSRHSQLLDLFAVTSPFLTAAIFAGKDTMQVLLNACERISAETDRRTFTQEQLHVLDDEGHNCLHLACIAKNSIALKLLLDTAHSSDLLNARDTVSGSTPLHCAARAADPNCIRFLLERDMVDPSIVDASGDPALLDLLSSEAVNLDALSTFLSFPRVDRKCTNTVTSQNGLHLAVMHGRLDETIMYQMVPPERKDDLRALINHKDADQQTPLHLACITGEESWISQLVNQWGAPLDSVDCEGVSPLLRFIHDHIDAGMEDKFSRIVKILTSAKTINLADNYGTTPMHIAVQSGSSTAVRLLITLAKGMKPEPTFEFKNIHGVTPASLAKAKRLGEIEQLLTDNKMGQ
jgi:ankyrin repeat protein